MSLAFSDKYIDTNLPSFSQSKQITLFCFQWREKGMIVIRNPVKTIPLFPLDVPFAFNKES